MLNQIVSYLEQPKTEDAPAPAEESVPAPAEAPVVQAEAPAEAPASEEPPKQGKVNDK